MRLHGWVEGKEQTLDVARPWRWRTRETGIPRRGRVAHVEIHVKHESAVGRDDEQAVAVVLYRYAVIPMVPEGTPVAWLADIAARRRQAEQGEIGVESVVVGEDAGELAREDLLKEYGVGMGTDEVAPRAADTP